MKKLCRKEAIFGRNINKILLQIIIYCVLFYFGFVIFSGKWGKKGEKMPIVLLGSRKKLWCV